MTITHDDLAVNEMLVDKSDLSAALLDANRRLHDLRAKQAQCSAEEKQNVFVALRPKRDRGDHRVEIVIPPPSDLRPEHPPQPIHTAEPFCGSRETIDLEVANRRLQDQQIAYAEAQKSPIRQYGSGVFDALKASINSINEAVEQADSDIVVDDVVDTVLLHPSIAVVLLQMEKVAVGRLWLLARSRDSAGKGYINVADLRECYANKQSEYRVCGWRRMRMLLAQGEGLFWEQDEDGRLWIYGVGHVAAILGLEKVEGVAVHVDVKTLFNIQSCRAQFYASWFGGRKTINPISRAKLTELTGVSEEQQRIYEQLANVQVTPCIALNQWDERAYPRGSMEEASYQRGAIDGYGAGVTFEFVDHKGKQGKAGEKYVAWHLPNQYTGRHKRAGKSSRRNINRYLKRKNILEKKLALGNVDSVDTREDEIVVPVFFPNVKAAVKRPKKARTAKEVYWEGTKSRSAQLWHVAPQGGGVG